MAYQRVPCRAGQASATQCPADLETVAADQTPLANRSGPRTVRSCFRRNSSDPKRSTVRTHHNPSAGSRCCHKTKCRFPVPFPLVLRWRCGPRKQSDPIAPARISKRAGSAICVAAAGKSLGRMLAHRLMDRGGRGRQAVLCRLWTTPRLPRTGLIGQTPATATISVR